MPVPPCRPARTAAAGGDRAGRRRRLALAGLLALTGCSLLRLGDNARAPHFYVEGRRLHDRCAEPVVLRGVNKMTVWTEPTGLPGFAEMARTGANSVRLVWLTTAPPEGVDEPLRNAVAHGMIPILELHDATGRWEGLEALVDYWVDPATVAALAPHQGQMLVNIGNEVGTHEVTDEQFVAGYTRAIRRMRAAGIRAPLVIDAAGWGRNAEQLLRAAPALTAADPQGDVLFSWHAWDTGDGQAARITAALESATAAQIPLLVGEFAHAEVGCRGSIPYRHLLAEAQRLGVGWLAWSWGPGNSDCGEMDMTEDGRFATLHDWGLEVAVTDANSIAHTSVRSRWIERGHCW